jgi:hypothetical protein
MSQEKLSKITFNVERLFTPGHARRCEAMIRNAAGGIEDVRANDVMGMVTITYDVKHLNPHTLRDIVDESGYSVIGD